MTTFTPSPAPSAQGTSKQVAARVRRAQFGDGYSQRARDGLNYVARGVTLSWPALTSAEADTLEAFFIAQGGADVFTYTLPLESTAYKWTCATWSRSPADNPIQSMTATLVQEFDL